MRVGDDLGARAAKSPPGRTRSASPASAARPSRVATGALLVVLGALCLALVGAAGVVLDLGWPLLAQGMLVVAIGGAILGVTLSAIGLLVTRDGCDPVGRRRAWLGVAVSVLLLVGLVVAYQQLRGPLVVPQGDALVSRPAPAR